jgi:paraquat-inducible protein B
MSEQIPIATISTKPNARVSAAWLVPILATIVAVILLLQWLHTRGPLVTITFNDAKGLTIDAPIMYRGAVVGRVERVQLDSNASTVFVAARLHASALPLARKGARWWIVRPEVSLEGVSGLDALISPRYLTLSVGTGPPLFSFVGSASSKIEGVSFTLITDSISGITLSTPLYYRGLVVGSVSNIQFAPNAKLVLIDIVVNNKYSNLIRTNTKFWSISGIDLDVGFTGVSMNIGPVASLLKGGIQLATPDPPEKNAPAGYGFRLEEEMDEDWLDWSPSLPLSRDLEIK